MLAKDCIDLTKGLQRFCLVLPQSEQGYGIDKLETSVHHVASLLCVYVNRLESKANTKDQPKNVRSL